MVNECALQAMPRQSLPETQPVGPSILLWPVHTVHFCPWMPGLHTQRPVICSQSSRTDPNNEHPHAKNWRKKAYENNITYKKFIWILLHLIATSFRINRFTFREICVSFILLTIYLFNFWHNTINLFHVITADYELPGTVWLMAGFCVEMIFKQQTCWVGLIMHVRHYNSRGTLFYLETIFCHFLPLLHCACGW